MATDTLSTTDRLLALLLVHDMHDASQKEKVFMLSRAGLTNADIAELLSTTPAVVAQSIYEKKNSKKHAPKKDRKRRTKKQ